MRRWRQLQSPAVRDTPRSVEPPPSPPIAEKSEAELTADAERIISAYIRALGGRDSAQVRRAFPAITHTLLGQWQTLYDAAEQVRVTLNGVQAVDKLIATPGAVARNRVKQATTYNVSGSRKAETRPTEYTATMRREANSGVLVSISERQ